jgi:hypothetical protein
LKEEKTGLLSGTNSFFFSERRRQLLCAIVVFFFGRSFVGKRKTSALVYYAGLNVNVELPFIGAFIKCLITLTYLTEATLNSSRLWRK